MFREHSELDGSGTIQRLTAVPRFREDVPILTRAHMPARMSVPKAQVCIYMYTSSCLSSHDPDNTFSHMRTLEVMHTSCICFTTYPHIRSCMDVRTCTNWTHVYVFNTFVSTCACIHRYTHPRTCVVRACLTYICIHPMNVCVSVLCTSQQA